ncbi:MAG: ATP-binding cassette domain-containing protein [Oscillospiraceae bacterium]|nr:ATP-binding cassette domain-containing protein [Oscillospiraceae bacterium]
MNMHIADLSKSYGRKRALIDFTCSFEPGVYGLLGPNGAGKSTLMGCIAKNLMPDSGSVVLDPPADILPVLGYMPQQQAVYDTFSARRFLYYMAGLKGIKRPKQEIEDLLEVVNLRGAAHRPMRTYSGGMKQRALLAQALLGHPKVILLDEPTAGLDPAERIRIRNFISKIASDKILIIATHVVADIEFIAQKVIILRYGRLVGAHSPEDWLRSAEGKVRECVIAEQELAGYQQKYKVSNIRRLAEGVSVRLVGDELPEQGLPVSPTMEDVYLYIHGNYES